MKSSLKFCVVATGEYDLYIADPRAYEWDIAAGHAILEHSGGTLTDFNGNKILYGKEDFKNPSLIAKGRIFYDKWAIKINIDKYFICFNFWFFIIYFCEKLYEE